jgi:hypothetical protein
MYGATQCNARWRSEEDSWGNIMLYESTKGLLQSIVKSLERGDRTRWDDQTESGNTCLYEMHQMSRPLYRAYKSDGLNPNSAGQNTIPEILSRAIPHVRMMVMAIRHKDPTRAIKSGKAALAEMNGARYSKASGENKATRESSNVVRQREKATRKHR